VPLFASVAKTRRAVIVHEAVKLFGTGREIASRINEELFGDLAAPVYRVGARFAPIPYAKGLEAALVAGSRGSDRPGRVCGSG
jgi:pyruvate dehydrogenase E1 component beta subunit